MDKINVDGHEIDIISKGGVKYISLTKMISGDENASNLIEKWLSNKNTVEYLGIWEQLNNPDFNSPEFGGIKNEAGSNRFYMSVKQWITKTSAIGIIAKSGRYGGTYAHSDIAFQFGMYISPLFNLLLVKEFQRLKDEEQNKISGEWDYRRFLVKVNYRLHTDAIKERLSPIKDLSEDKKKAIYISEAELLNFALFDITSKDWKLQNAELVLQNRNIRDYADAHQLIVLSNMESLNAQMIKEGIKKEERLLRLRSMAQTQLESLKKSNYSIEKIQSPFTPKQIVAKTDINENKKELGDFDKTVKKFLDTPVPPAKKK